MASDRTTEQFDGPEEFRAWLREHHDASPGIWMKLAKKGSGLTTVTYDEAVEVALTFGWIDGQARSGDDTYWLQGFTRRRPRSPWSRRNRERAEALIAAGAMEPSGLAEVERARADGRWDRAYEGPRTAEPPADLLEALAARPAAKAFFATLNRTNRFAILYRIQDAKRPETRARRIARFVDMLEQGETIYP
ncbi:MAG TPA: YdeI/OmpD-associated family protein [Actinomycetota bacterium]|jgi:uncharacterized protein YdeI (YjbR/CyaY-like superfamily)|nr:YdeI/OmpD-associated family protein [Actinomycetota bacterium]